MYTHLDILVLLYVATFDPEDAGLSVKVDGLHGDGESGSDLLAARAAGSGLCLHLPASCTIYPHTHVVISHAYVLS